MMPPGEDRGTLLYCDPSNSVKARLPATFERLQLLEDGENLLYKEYLRSFAQKRMHGEHGFLRLVLCDQTIGYSNRGYLLAALQCLEFGDFVPRGTFFKWERILKSHDPLAAARGSASGAASAAGPLVGPSVAGRSVAGWQRLPASTTDDRPVNPFVAAAVAPFEATADYHPATSFSSMGHHPLRIASSTDSGGSVSDSSSTGIGSLGSLTSMTSSDRGATPSPSLGGASLRERYSTSTGYGGASPSRLTDDNALPRSTTTRDPRPGNGLQDPSSRTDPNRRSCLPSSASGDGPNAPASMAGRGRGPGRSRGRGHGHGHGHGRGDQ